MGLGKSLQALTFLHTVLSHGDKLGVSNALILCPLSITSNWQNECDRWLKTTEFSIPVYNLSQVKKGAEVSAFQQWKSTGGIGILHYNAAVAYLEAKKPKKSQKSSSLIIEEQNPGSPEEVTILEPVLSKKKCSLEVMEKLMLDCHILVCDEGHVLKNPKSAFNKTVSRFTTKRKIILTGTPLQNNLGEYYTMVDLIKPNLLGSSLEFSNGFTNPIGNGLHNDSKPEDVQLMKRRIYVLNEKLRGCVQRKDYAIFKQFLKPKFEYALIVNLSDVQNKLYEKYLATCVDGDKLLKHYHTFQVLKAKIETK